uniref:Calmodulin like 4 n=1 Tax=Sander lucioperca TaxID=283035 RepID=A0A8D0DAD8_SANLU
HGQFITDNLQFKECFSLYDRQRKGKIEARELITVMRCLGSNPTPSEVQRHLLNHTTDWSGELDFSTFLSIMHRQLQQEAPQDEILEAMRMADKEQKGFILASELRAKLTGLGEKLTHREGKNIHTNRRFTHILTLKNTKLIYK